MGISRTLFVVVILIPVLFAAGFVRLIRIAGNNGFDTFCFWAWQEGRIEFIHSVTGQPVSIHFRLPWRFSQFSARTDRGTEEYYTEGGYSWNETLARQRTQTIECCSELGMTFTVGQKVFRVQKGCLSASVIWPP